MLALSECCLTWSPWALYFISFYFDLFCFWVFCLFIKIRNKTPRIPDTLSIFLSLKTLISFICHFILLSNVDTLWIIHQLSPHLPHQPWPLCIHSKGRGHSLSMSHSVVQRLHMTTWKQAQRGIKVSCVSAQWGKRPALSFGDSGEREERVEGGTAVYVGLSDSVLWEVMGKQRPEGSEGITQGLWREDIPARESGKCKAWGRQMQWASWTEWVGERGGRWLHWGVLGQIMEPGGPRGRGFQKKGAHQSCGAHRRKNRCLHKGRHH